MHGIKAEAARDIGKTPKWLENRERNHLQFGDAVKAVLSRKWSPIQVTRALAMDTLGISMVALENWLPHR